ncbi:hypothetical protein KR059_006872 [Drosophila kikkawai]|nr:hypothetical protein KR059_006872 [Drosophila kikkawai]
MERLDDDIVDLMSRRAYDVDASLKVVSVFLNGNKLTVKNFKDYIDLHVKNPDDGPVIKVIVTKFNGDLRQLAHLVSKKPRMDLVGKKEPKQRYLRHPHPEPEQPELDQQEPEDLLLQELEQQEPEEEDLLLQELEQQEPEEEDLLLQEPEQEDLFFLGFQDSWILDIVDDPARPSGVLFNNNAMTKIKEASANRCFYLMLDVIHIKSPIPAHMMLILATTEDGKINQVVYSKVVCIKKHKLFNAMEVLDCLECVLKSVWEEGLHQHQCGNVVLREAGFPVITDLCHLQDRMTAKGHVDVVLEDVHKTSVFQKADYKDKFSLIRRIANDLPRSPWSRTEA